MSAGRVRALEIGAEGGGFELDAELDELGVPSAFFAWRGGAHGFEELFEEEPEPRVEHGPLSLRLHPRGDGHSEGPADG